jgi:hypothetical protein
MSRNFFIQTHLFIAALFTPMVLLMATSGGLYLLGVKGNVVRTEIVAPQGAHIDLSSDTLESDVITLIKGIEPTFTFEYVKVKDKTLYTRPTSRQHYEIRVSENGLSIFKNSPSMQQSLIELHKGHGPRTFKTAQKAMAFGLVVVLLTGAWLGLSSRILRNRTAAALLVGTIVAIFLAVFV